MKTFSILCFSGGVLIDSKKLEAPGLVECLAAVGDHDCARIEVWAGDERVALLRQAVPHRSDSLIRRSR